MLRAAHKCKPAIADYAEHFPTVVVIDEMGILRTVALIFFGSPCQNGVNF
jgi:hypothetical protein